MKGLSGAGTLLIVAALLAGCAQDSSTPFATAPDEPGLASKGKGGQTDEDSRAIWVWYRTLDSGLRTGIHGDGKNTDGSPRTDGDSEYQGEMCGVHARIFWWDASASRAGDAVFDPDWSREARCPRTLYFDLDRDPDTAPWAAGIFTNVRQVMQLQAGESRDQVMGFSYSNIPNCERLRFGEPDPADTEGLRIKPGTPGGVNVTRLQGSSSSPNAPGVWGVVTRDGVGQCWNTVKGKLQPSGPRYENLHFRITITEVPHGS